MAGPRLEMIPPKVGFVDGEVLGVLGCSLAGLLWMLLPFIELDIEGEQVEFFAVKNGFVGPMAYRPRRIFVNSMSDLFHESVPDEWIDRIFAVMALCPQHVFQVLTKRPKRMLAYTESRQRSVPSATAASLARACEIN